MKNSSGKGLLLAVLLLFPSLYPAQTPDLKTIKLNDPDLNREFPVMKAFSARASIREWSDKELSLQDLSDLLWAANGINRSDSKKRTAPSAMNAQDIDIFVFDKNGIYLYDALGKALVPVAAGDHRAEIGMRRGPGPGGPPRLGPVHLVLVSDASRFRHGTPELKNEWGALDAGTVSQNIALFCASAGMGTVPRAAIAKDKIRELLKLSETQNPFLEHPVGYLKQGDHPQ
jgi:SagB-type dehydrogenase family enzyme